MKNFTKTRYAIILYSSPIKTTTTRVTTTITTSKTTKSKTIIVKKVKINKAGYEENNLSLGSRPQYDKDSLDPYQVQMLAYRAEMYIMMRYQNLLEINTTNANFSKQLNPKSKFFVIKSFSEEDVHKVTLN